MSELPAAVVDEAERLTRLARAATDDAEREAYREERASVLADHGFTARVREDDTNAVLVCYPDEWIDDGTVRTDRIDDTDRAAERRLSGPGDPDDWLHVAAHNDRVVARVAERHGDVHAANARAFADFMSNHYARRIETATETERREFREEYFVRNAWPSAEQRSVVEQSLTLTLDAARSFATDSAP
ncbi:MULTISPECIES: DUF7108 family protein [Halococcus]|uniref:RnhA operon protein n=1 Tax=Halococcus salifodinae DSM 8989 TaxID=1227456 RepID=M0NAG1_9EURY|nr:MULTISPECIES: hypothetical protein [Halococcus]EMA53640.1 hypothetical protein C450_07012 [Halococcus salifodinae DSM 8989]